MNDKLSEHYLECPCGKEKIMNVHFEADTFVIGCLGEDKKWHRHKSEVGKIYDATHKCKFTKKLYGFNKKEFASWKIKNWIRLNL